MTDLRDAMKWAMDGRYRSVETIAERSGYTLTTVRTYLPRMERKGQAEWRRGIAFGHGNRKLWRLVR